MTKILLTGSNGFVGRRLVGDLLQDNYIVIATARDNNARPFAGEKFSFFIMDFTNEQQVKDVFDQVNPSVVIHCGAMSKPDECELNKDAALRTNLYGTELLLKYAGAVKSHFIYLSTDFVFDGSKAMHKEEDEPAPVNFYGHTKLLGENAVRRYTGNWTIVRTVLVYGNPMGGRDNILTLTKKKLEKAELFKVVNDQQRTPTYIEDLSSGIIAIVRKRATGIFHLCGKDMMTPFDMAFSAAKYLQLDASLLQKVTAESFKEIAKRPLLSGFSISKAEKELDFMPHSFEEGLKKTFE
ncbi:MAG: SDR family oxidoreductase [Ferruginibacter sp.]